MSGGSLLRLFQSDYFDAHMHMHYLMKMEQSGVQDYLVNELYKTTDDDIDFYLPQLCQVSLIRFQRSSLHRFLLDKVAQSMHFALKIHWMAQSVVEDRQPEVSENALSMVNMCETSVVNAPGTAGVLSLQRSTRPPRVEANRAEQKPLTRSKSTEEMALPVRRASEAAIAHHSSERSNDPGERLQHRRSHSADAPRRRMGLANRMGFRGEAELPKQRSGSLQAVLAGEWQGGATSSSATPPPSRRAVLRKFAELSHTATAEQKAEILGCPASMPNAYLDLGSPAACWAEGNVEEEGLEGEMRQFMLKRCRCDYFNTQNHLISMMVKLSTALVSITEKPERTAALGTTLALMNRWLLERRAFMALSDEGQLGLLGLHIPILKQRDARQQILRFHPPHCRVFASATRAPFLLVYETAILDESADESEDDVVDMAAESSLPLDVLSRCVLEELRSGASGDVVAGDDAAALDKAGLHQPMLHLWRHLLDMDASAWQAALAAAGPPSRAASKAAAGDPKAAADGGVTSPPAPNGDRARRSEEAAKQRLSIWGEPWRERCEQLRSASPFGKRYKSWELNAVLVKGGDDLRQELLASQIIRQFGAVFKEAGLPLWLKPIEVLVTSSTSGFIECIHDSVSIDGLKRQYPGKTLADIFRIAFADMLFEAKKNFIESCAAYSLVVWFLQVKDRHNANLMLDSSGHVVHIDFGFMLSNSPGGNMGFEQSPFKLTQEFLDVMDGECSDQYEYFRTLVIRGFLEARKHMERIILPIRMMLQGSKLPCFREGPDWVFQTLRERFFLNLTEEACIEKIVDLIDSSVNNWRTIQYDNYQRIVHGIL